MLVICQVCVFRFIRWAYLALPFQLQVGTQDTVSLGLGVVHVSERFVACVSHLMTDILFQVYKEWGNETVSLVPFISGLPTIYSSNLDVARQISGGGTKNNFIKPEASHASLL